MELQPIATHGPYVFVPLYAFESDVDVLDFSQGVQICRYDPEKLELLLERWDYLKDYLSIYPTRYLIQARPPGASFSMKTREEAEAFVVEEFEFGKEWFRPAHDLVEALRLFKPGYFARGPDWFCVTRESLIEREGHPGVWGLGACCSRPGGDDAISLSTGEAATYRFEAAELVPFGKFHQELALCRQRPAESRKLSLALSYYNSSFGHKSEQSRVIDLFVCLEALLLQGKEELTFRLATRAANLLEADAGGRKKCFSEIRDFYNLRSKIVHGEILHRAKPK